MDADTTTQHKTSSDESPSEEVTTTNNENNVTVCSDNENGNFEAEILEKETTFPNERSELMKQTEKQLEIVIMEESLNEDDLQPAPISNKVCEQTKEETEVEKQPETSINTCENKTNEQTEAEDLLEDVLEANTTTEREDDTHTSAGDFKMDEGTAESPASRQNNEGPESSEEVGDSDQEEEEEEEEDDEEEEEEDDETRREANIPTRRKGRTKKGPLNPDAPKDGKVERILQMRYKRSIKHYHVQWAGKDSSHNSWLILDPTIAGFMEQVAVYDERRKKANDRGEGSSSKKTSRTKHSWYYLSSSEDEDSILKDNFWKNLDEGKLNLYQSPSDMYSTLKEVGRNSKSYNQEVRAAIPEDYLAETKRVTRSRVLTPVVKKSKALSKVRKVAESDSTETMSSEKKDKPTGKRKPQKTPSKTPKKEPAKRTAPKKPKTAKKKAKSEGSDVVSQVSMMSNEDDDEDDQASEDDVSDMLVPISNQSKAEENPPANEIVPGGVTKKGKRIKKIKAPTSKPVISESDDNNDDSIKSNSIHGEVKDDKVEDKSRDEILRHLEECINSVVEDSRRWYEEQFGDNVDKIATTKDTSDNQPKDGEAVDDDDDDDDGDEIVVHKRVKAVKRKKGWTSFLDPKKRKVKLDKFKDKEDESTNAEDNDEGKPKPSKEEEKSDQSSEVGEPKEKSANVSEAAEVGREEKPETDARETETDGTKEKEEKNESVEEGVGSKPDSPKPMDQQTKLELAKRVSQYIMKGSVDKKDRKSSSDESSNKSASKDDQSESHSRGEGERRSSVEESKSCKDVKKLSSGPSFNLKLMRPEDIASKLEKMSRTYIDSSRSPNVQFLLAIKNNDIVKVRTMLESGVQINMEFIDMKTGLSLVWLAVKNNLISILVLLATHGADIDKRNRDGLTPLLYAADKGLFQTVHILCQLGVNLYTTAPDGDTAIVKAIKNRHKSVVEILLGTGIGLGDNALAEKNLTQLAKHVGSNDVIEVINFHKARLNKELLLKASQCFESSVKIEQPVFPIQSFRMIDSKHFKISFRHELQASKKTRGMLLFIGQGQVTHNDVICSLKGKSQISRVVLNDHQLQSISDDPNFVFSFTLLVDGVNRLEISTQSLSRENYQTHLIVCAYSIELDL